MDAIQKFSLIYDAGEDRLAWDGEDRQGVTTRLWLTQRFCKGFVEALVPMLEKAASRSAPPGGEAAVHSWEQAAAMTGFGKLPPVRPDARAVTGLVRVAHITPSAKGMVVKFEFCADESRTLALHLAATRQMLAVIHRLHKAAGWAQDAFPGWIDPAGQISPSDALN